ncbi:MAG: ATP-dependent RNA helicase HrpA [Gammaproteobacteria bacterium]|nr:ATP-dependent RNA helicase HrpA [Gammaproteobacteria bacterium]
MNPTLPIAAHFDEIEQLLAQHQVILVAGETGSGKSTQLPQLCLHLGYAREGLIGHTQPRRIAAKSIASRIAEELKVSLGSTVGYQVRFNESCSPSTQIKVMTDGILLAEIGHDPLLKRYSLLIIDEAHERSLNIDFLLGFLKKMLPRRPDLKVIITSATLEHERLAAYFNAPLITVEGRSHPIEIRYRPEASLMSALIDLHQRARGDVLVFLPTERDIREYRKKLVERFPRHEILALYARLPLSAQQKVFHPGNSARIILATNVAETSLTVPRVLHVIDSGQARVSRFNSKLKIQRLPIEPISQANAKQRAGRAGRVAPGICIRLYEEADLLNRPAYLEPEILRTNLSAVILQMMQLRLGSLEDFDLLDPPPRALIHEGYAELFELQAIDAQKKLTSLGRQISRFSLDPRLARMLCEAHQNRTLAEVAVIVSNLSTQDPREYPEEQLSKAKALHQRYAHPDSEFLTILKLWQTVMAETEGLSKNKFRAYCEAHFLSPLRMQEWQSVLHEIHVQFKILNWSWSPLSETPSSILIHQALLTGCLHFVAEYDKEKQCYRGAHQKLLKIFPGSALAQKKFKWMMAESLMETKHTYARIVARIEVSWLEPLCKHLVKYQYSEPYYDIQNDAVMTYQSVLLYGLMIVSRRKMQFSHKNPILAREVFIRDALVDREKSQAGYLKLLQAEAKLRRLGIAPSDEEYQAFFELHLPMDVVSFKTLKSLPLFDPESYLAPFKKALLDYPDEIEVNGQALKLKYVFDWDHDQDGVCLEVPLLALSNLPNLPYKIKVMNAEGQCLALSSDLAALKEQFKMELTALLKQVPNILPQGDFQSWDFADFPAQMDWQIQGKTVRVYPALKCNEQGVCIEAFPDAESAALHHEEGVLYLLEQALSKELRALRQDPFVQKACSEISFIAEKKTLIDEFSLMVLEDFYQERGIDFTVIYTQADFQKWVDMRGEFWNHQASWLTWLTQLRTLALPLRVSLRSLPQKQGLQASQDDLYAQFEFLLSRHFLSTTPIKWLKRYPIYLKGMQLRIERLKNNLSRELTLFNTFQPLWQRFLNSKDPLKMDREALRWMFQEWRLNIFSQELKSIVSVSEKKIQEMLSD